MSDEVHAIMTGLEFCFEEELSSLPGWHSDIEPEVEELDHATIPEESETLEETMVLGM